MRADTKETYGAIRDQGRLAEVEFEGCLLVLDKEAVIWSGDIYFTPGRNTGPKLFTCLRHNLDTHCVFPREVGYVFDTWECYKVVKVDGEDT